MIILGTNSIKDTGYEVANSCRFNDGDSAFLSKTFSGAGTRTKYTISVWVKRGVLGTTQCIFSAGTGTDNSMTISFNGADNRLYWNSYSNDGANYDYFLNTTRRFRDVSAWYHIVCAFDSTQGTASNRQKMYVNGVQQDAFEVDTYSGSYSDYAFNNILHEIGQDVGAGSRFFDGYMAEFCAIDGLQLAPTDFGEYDEDSPTIWKPKDVSGLTFGTNGFYLDFENSSELGTDVSGNSNTFTENNLAATDQATDTCTNNFCTLNSINPRHANLTMSEGNCALASSNSQWLGTSSTIAVSAGKWYVEWKYIAGHNMKFGIVGNGGVDVSWLTANQSYGGYSPIGYEYQFNNSGTGYRVNNNSDPSWTNGSFTAADSIIIMAFDIDAGKIWWGRNGTWFNNTGTANPATGTDASTTGISSDNGPYVISCALEGSGSTGFVNFGGCPSFSISSGNADGDGYGKFEYEPPSGYFSLCTKNLAEYGG